MKNNLLLINGKRVEDLEANNEPIDKVIADLNIKINEIERYIRNKNIEIGNIPILEKLICNIAKEFNINLNSSGIDSVQRVPSRNKTKLPQIIVQAKSKATREKILSEKTVEMFKSTPWQTNI
ncbi:hypothetical protein JTB14_028067 [Gonioctena quinquepunctata]|nr:hypothetical protein JTB14_028067 [Gonioctena quinquepunctata]